MFDMIICFDFVRVPYFELLPSISFAKGNILFSWLVWGMFVRWGVQEEETDE